MTHEELDGFRNQLIRLRERLTGDYSSLADAALRGSGGEASGNLSNAPFHLADLGTDNFEQELSLSLLENKEQAVEEIDAALRRLEAGTFGRCERCGKEIPLSRLRTLPYTRYDVDCASLTEKETPGDLGRTRV